MSALVNIAQQANELQQQYQSGQISASEFKELCEDLKIVQQIADDANDFERDQQYRAFILGVIQVASAIPL
jgi:tape measure domain-containing protein